MIRTYEFEGLDMARATVTHLLIATVLICPYLCLGELTESVSCAQAVGCSCCHDPLGQDNDAPESPEDGDQDCLCHGAIAAVKVESPETSASESSFAGTLALDLDRSVLSGSGLLSLDSRRSVHFPPLCSGREICALINVRLL